MRLLNDEFDKKIIRGNEQFSLVFSTSNASFFDFQLNGPFDTSNREAGSMDYVVTINAVPEPSTGFLFGAFALGTALLRRRNA